jgi:hypothetical protein
MDYTVPAIPTIYRGRQYRSRLEAKWAAFFDLMHWEHEYEPLDLGQWSPDFSLLGHPGLRDSEPPFLVEVKPIQTFARPVADQMASGAAASELMDARPLLLLGLRPMSVGRHVYVGWAARPRRFEAPREWSNAVLGAAPRALMHRREADWPIIAFGAFSAFADPDSSYALQRWVAASNAVQYKPRRAT